MSEPVRVLIVDDQEPFRRIAASVVAATPGFEVVGAVATGEESVHAASRLQPQVVLMDVVLPGIDGLAATRRIRTTNPATTVVLLSTYAFEDYGPEALACGAAAFVSKGDFGPDVLLGLDLSAARD